MDHWGPFRCAQKALTSGSGEGCGGYVDLGDTHTGTFHDISSIEMVCHGAMI